MEAARSRLRVNRYLFGVRDVGSSYLRIARLAPTGGKGLVGALVVLNLVMGLLPILFVLGTSVMIGRVPAAVAGGVGSGEWRALVISFVLAASAFLLEQLLCPIKVSLGELLARRIDGLIYHRLIHASLLSDGIGPLEDQGLLDELSQAVTTLEQSVRTPGLAYFVPRGVYVLGVRDPGNARASGLRAGDVILSVDGESVPTVEALQEVYRRLSRLDRGKRTALLRIQRGAYLEFIVLDFNRDYKQLGE